MPIPSLVNKAFFSRGTAQLRLQIDVFDSKNSWKDLKNIKSLIYQAATALEECPIITKQSHYAVCIALSTDSEVETLNFMYRGKKSPTNVLSFPSALKSFSQSPQFIGDIILARETIERETKEKNISFSAHVSHLIIHGLLHLFGYDHNTEAEALRMEEVEIAVLARLGISNPYKSN